MKVTGPNSGAGVGAPDAAADVGDVGKDQAADGVQGSGRAFADKLAAGAPAGAVAPAELNATARVAGDLDAGRLTPAAAVDQILEQVLAQQVGPDAPAAVREQVRAALRDALENDPLLAEKLRRVGA